MEWTAKLNFTNVLKDGNILLRSIVLLNFGI